MEVRSDPTPISSREPFSVGLQKSPPVHSPTPQTAIPNMRMTFSSDGSSMYKQVSATSPPHFQGSGGGTSGTSVAAVVPAGDGVARPAGPRPRLSVNSGEQPLKRKRGRPRKYGPDGSMSIALAPVPPSSTHAPPHTAAPPPPPPPAPAPVPSPSHTAPVPSPSPAAPGHSPSPAAPVHSPSPAAPVHSPSPAAPVHSPSTAAPVHSAASASPLHTPPPAAPVHTPAPSAPANAPTPAPAPVSGGFSPSSGTRMPASPPPSDRVFSVTIAKKPRGRPPGSVPIKKRQPPAMGLGGSGFKPHVITVKTGEDVSSKIMSFLQQGPQAVCILSANGAISNVTLRQAATSGGTVTYEGRFEILSLSGSYFLSEIGGQRSRTGGLSISLAGPDGRVLGGGVAGVLTAASPVQLVLGSFNADDRKEPKETDTAQVIRFSQGNLRPSSPPSRGTASESSGGSGSPFNQTTFTYNNGTPQGMSGVQWK